MSLLIATYTISTQVIYLYVFIYFATQSALKDNLDKYESISQHNRDMTGNTKAIIADAKTSVERIIRLI